MGETSALVGKCTLSEELREARREARMWRRRAEWAEGRLLGLGVGVGEESCGGEVGGKERGEDGNGGEGKGEGKGEGEGEDVVETERRESRDGELVHVDAA